MQRARITAAAVAVATIGLGAWAVSSQATESHGKTFTVTGHQTTAQFVDAAPAGDSGGDLGALGGTLTRDGHAAGRYVGVCVQIDADNHSQCQFTLALPEGQLVLATGYGPGMNGDEVTHEPIVGGTGDYAKARGYAVGREQGEDTIIETIHLEG